MINYAIKIGLCHEVFSTRDAAETKIKSMYWSALHSYVNNLYINYDYRHSLRCFYDEVYGADLYALEKIPKGTCLFDISESSLFIIDPELQNKYAAYIWHDNYICPLAGMIVNNIDNDFPISNCAFDGSKFVTTETLLPGNRLRTNYNIESSYPPIPEEFIEIRKSIFNLK